jgi:uncharacterized membrane protein (DUF106 family)
MDSVPHSMNRKYMRDYTQKEKGVNEEEGDREKQIIGSKQSTAKNTQSSLKKTQNQLMIGIIHCRTIVVF